jgi:uncharacterized protein (DUF58 family)
MIVPRSKLLLWVGILIVPLTVLGGAVPSVTIVCGVAIGAFLLVVAVDAIFAGDRMRGIAVESCGIARMSKDREGAILLQIVQKEPRARVVRLGLAFPPEIAAPNQELSVELPNSEPFSQIMWPCTPLKRGNYFLERCYTETQSRLGFWDYRNSSKINSEIRVYPNLAREKKSVPALFLNRGMFGMHAQRQVGQGRDFEKLRDYLPGDSIDEIHWKATAKRGQLVTKLFQIERTQEVYVVIDASRLNARKTTAAGSTTEGVETTVDRFVTAALILGLAAEQQGDLYGILTFSDRIQKFVRARNGKAHFSACREALYMLHPQSVTPDFDELGAFIRLRLRRRALLVVLTSLDDPVLAESFVRNLKLISRQHLVLVNTLKPRLSHPVFSQKDVSAAGDLYQELSGHMLWHNLRELERTIQRQGATFTQLEDERLAASLVSQYVNVKQRQLI